jgi:hypothetical protein
VTEADPLSTPSPATLPRPESSRSSSRSSNFPLSIRERSGSASIDSARAHIALDHGNPVQALLARYYAGRRPRVCHVPNVPMPLAMMKKRGVRDSPSRRDRGLADVELKH